MKLRKQSLAIYLNVIRRDTTKLRALLEGGFGSGFIVSEAFQRKLNAWPKVGNRDYAGLRQFSDFLNQCKVALAATPDLYMLDDMSEIGKLNEKLPFHIQEKWLSRAFEIKC